MEKLISIVGLTSSGKSDLAIALAQKFNGEIVSADSRQVYRGLDYCSGKVSKAEQKLAPHHLLDVANLGEQFTLYDYQKMAYKAIDSIIGRGKIPFLVGGTGLYSRSVVEGYNLSEGAPNKDLRQALEEFSFDELRALCSQLDMSLEREITKRQVIRLLEKSGLSTTDLEKFKRGERLDVTCTELGITVQKQPKYDVLQIGIRWDREKIYQRIKLRLEKRMPKMIEEIQSLIDAGADVNFLKQLGLEAKCVAAYLLGEYNSYDEFFDDLYKEERHFAKRQQTWYNKEQDTVWLDAEDDLATHAERLVQEFLNKG